MHNKGWGSYGQTFCRFFVNEKSKSKFILNQQNKKVLKQDLVVDNFIKFNNYEKEILRVFGKYGMAQNDIDNYNCDVRSDKRFGGSNRYGHSKRKDGLNKSLIDINGNYKVKEIYSEEDYNLVLEKESSIISYFNMCNHS